MTTIAYKDGVIAYDSFLTNEHTITNDDYDKHRCKDGVHFFFSGLTCAYDLFMDAYFGRELDVNLNISALIVDGGKVYSSSTTVDNVLWKQDITGMAYAIGCGSDHAFTAMDLGFTAVVAIRMAIKRDLHTGGRIRKFKVR